MAKTVKDYGAIGDGVTDDTGAFNAMDTAENGVVIIPAGTYRINGRVGKLNRTKGSQIVGEGPDRTTLILGANGGLDIGGEHNRVEGITFRASGIVAQAIRSDYYNYSSVYGLLRRLNFVGSDANNRFEICLDLYKYWYSSIEDCQFRNYGADALYAGSAIKWHSSTNNTVTGCTFAGMRNAYWVTADKHPVENNACEGHNVSNCVWVKNDTSIQLDAGLYMSFVNNTIDLARNGRPNVFSDASNTVLIGNWFGNLEERDVDPSSLGAPVWITGDLFVIKDNIFSQRLNFGNAIILSGLFGGVISGNMFDQGSQSIGALQGYVDSIAVYGNVFQNNANATVNLSNVSNLTWYGNVERSSAPRILPGSYNGADGPQPSSATPARAGFATTIVIQTYTTAESQTFNVSFPAGRFSSTPIVTAVMGFNTGAPVLVYVNDNVTATGCQVILKSANGSQLGQGQYYRLNIIAQENG